MTTNRVIVGLLAAVLAMQLGIYFKGLRPSTPRPTAEPVTEPPEGTVVDITGMPARGENDSPLVLVEFSDYECPFCARHATEVAPVLEKEYVETGKLRLAFANNPLAFHRNAKFLATVAICAGAQDQYWQMHDVLFESKPKTEEEVMALVPELRLDVGQLRSCVESGTEASRRIESDIKQANSLGLRGTPSFALGLKKGGGKVEIKKLIRGAGPLNLFQREIDAAMMAKAGQGGN